MNIVALIPARGGSRRIPGKNIKPLAGRPLIQWTIEAARESGVFGESIYCCTDDMTPSSDCTGAIAARCGIQSITRAPAGDDEPDIVWVRQALALLKHCRRPDAFAILRPTSPFRTANTIRRAWAKLRRCADAADSLRAIQPVKEHPGKMWTWEGEGYAMRPYVALTHPDGTPWHSSPTQTLPKVYVQNASLEMSWTSNVEVHGTISGRKIVPFLTEGWEGYDINEPEDFARAEAHARDLEMAAMARKYDDQFSRG